MWARLARRVRLGTLVKSVGMLAKHFLAAQVTRHLKQASRYHAPYCLASIQREIERMYDFLARSELWRRLPGFARIIISKPHEFARSPNRVTAWSRRLLRRIGEDSQACTERQRDGRRCLADRHGGCSRCAAHHCRYRRRHKAIMVALPLSHRLCEEVADRVLGPR